MTEIVNLPSVRYGRITDQCDDKAREIAFSVDCAGIAAALCEAFKVGRAAALAWLPIEAAPKDGSLFLAFDRGATRGDENPRWGWHLASWDHTENAWCDEQTGEEVHPAVWQPLSPPPEPHG